MVNIDLSKILQHKALIYLTALVPGLFFEVALLLGDPELVASIEYRERHVLNLNTYVGLFIAVFLAFLIGHLFMTIVTLIQYFLRFVYRTRVFLQREICRTILFPLSNRLTKKPFWVRYRFALSFHRWIVDHAFLDAGEENAGYRCWRATASMLLKKKYDVDLDELKREWSYLYWNLGSPTAPELRGQLLAVASHAAGWCGLAAAWITPQLRSRYFLGFCIALIVVGLIHDYQVASRLADPVWIVSSRIRALLREYGGRVPTPVEQEEPEHDLRKL